MPETSCHRFGRAWPRQVHLQINDKLCTNLFVSDVSENNNFFAYSNFFPAHCEDSNHRRQRLLYGCPSFLAFSMRFFLPVCLNRKKQCLCLGLIIPRVFENPISGRFASNRSFLQIILLPKYFSGFWDFSSYAWRMIFSQDLRRFCKEKGVSNSFVHCVSSNFLF